MYTLRKITGEGIQVNFCLGNHYSLITKEHNPKDFEEIFKKEYGEEYFEYKELCYGFITSEDVRLYSLMKNQQNYIMTESGKTFSNVSFK